MKTPLLLLALSITLGAATAAGQLPATGGTVHNLTLDVENKGAGGGLATTGNTGLPNVNLNNNNNGNNTNTTSSTQTRNHGTTLGVTIRSLDKTDDQVKVEWYFFAKDVQNYRAGKEHVFDSGTKTVNIAPTGEATFDIVSKVAKTTRTTKTTVTNNNNNNNRNQPTYNTTETQGGTEISGWVVRIWVDGRIYDAKGSDFRYEDAAKDPDKFAQLKAGKEPQ